MPNQRHNTALNAVCPYYTMYPLSFPLSVLERRSAQGGWVLDPFCGRGTTNFAARLLGLSTVGIDSSCVAVALAQAKVMSATPAGILSVARRILRTPSDHVVPSGEFWTNAFHPRVLHDLCSLRASLLRKCDTPARVLLRAIILGALHGPLTKTSPSYFSNQSPRTFAPKPKYAVRFWHERSMQPPKVDTLALLKKRTFRYLGEELPKIQARIIRADSRNSQPYGRARKFRFVITSPPYYGMRTYIPDQWLRVWFLGGPEEVDYSQAPDQLEHNSAESFVDQLSTVWEHSARVCTDDALMVVRFGGIRDRKACPISILKESLRPTRWRLVTAKNSGKAPESKLQSNQFRLKKRTPVPEYDFYAHLS